MAKDKTGGPAFPGCTTSAAVDNSEPFTLEKLQQAMRLIEELGPAIKTQALITKIFGVGIENPYDETPDDERPHEITFITKIGPFKTKEDAVKYMNKKFPEKHADAMIQERNGL